MSKTCYQCFNEIEATQTTCPICGFNPEKNNADYPFALPSGSVLAGRYIVGKVLGQGGFGITYVAKDHKTGKRVAIKEYMPDGMSMRTKSNVSVSLLSLKYQNDFIYGKDCFLEEAKTLSRFRSHPNVVTIYAYFEENGTAYFVMEYLEGCSFQQYLNQHGGTLSWAELVSVIRPVMHGLKAVHSQGIIHRDMTPENIYITGDGEVKILDFGAARYSMGEKSQSLDIILKHGYAPKEQYARHGKQGPFTDIYALGATMYKALTGKRPPDAIGRLDDDPFLPPSVLGVSMPKRAEQALIQALAVRHDDRFQSVAAMMAAMDINGEEKAEEKIDRPEDEKAVSDRILPETVQPAVSENQISAEVSANDEKPEDNKDQIGPVVIIEGKKKPSVPPVLIAILICLGILVGIIAAANAESSSNNALNSIRASAGLMALNVSDSFNPDTGGMYEPSNREQQSLYAQSSEGMKMDVQTNGFTLETPA